MIVSRGEHLPLRGLSRSGLVETYDGSVKPVELLGVYDADGGLRGEVAYVVGHLLGRRECALCDITHTPVRRKPAWDTMIADLGLPFRLRHLNELSPAEQAAVAGSGAPAVLTVDGDRIDVLLDAAALGRAGGDVAAFRVLLEEALEGRR